MLGEGEEKKKKEKRRSSAGERKMAAKSRCMVDATVSLFLVVACIVPASLADSILKPLNMSEVLLST